MYVIQVYPEKSLFFKAATLLLTQNKRRFVQQQQNPLFITEDGAGCPSLTNERYIHTHTGDADVGTLGSDWI